MTDAIAPLKMAPEGACDTHMHVFGPREKYPPATNERYEPPYAPLDVYRAEMGAVGFTRTVVVQPSAYGFDNSCTLDALAELGDAARGIVHIKSDVTDEVFQDLHDRGVRGVRINTSPIKPFDPDYADQMIPEIERMGARLAGTGWCIEFLNPGWLTEALMPTMSSLPVNFILCHFGMFKAAAGVDQEGFQKMMRMVEAGRCWIKMTGLYRFTDRPDMTDAEPYFRTFAAAVPERLIWGSDYPHLSFADRVDNITLYNLFCQWIEDDAVRKQILVDNPTELFGFS